MTDPGPMSDLVVSFRDLDQPRPLSARLIAVAFRYPDTWTCNIPELGSTEHPTFDACADRVARETGCRHLLIAWPAGRSV